MISHESPIKIAEKVPLLSFEEARVNTALCHAVSTPMLLEHNKNVSIFYRLNVKDRVIHPLA